MANLRRADRGQIILIAAFALAVTFVALALIVNSAIFTENLASRGETGGSDDALEARVMVETSAGEALYGANVHNTSSDSALEDGVEEGIVHSQRQLELQQVTSGVLVDVSLVSSSPVYGSRIVQNESDGRAFVDSDGPGELDAGDEWQVVTRARRFSADHNATRAFEMNVSELPSSADPFIVRANGTGGSPKWRMEVYSNTIGAILVGDTITVDVTTPSGSEDCTVSADRGYTHIDVTEGTVDGTPCDALQRGFTDSDGLTVYDGRFAHGVGDEYNITFENGDAVRGNYSLVTRTTGASTTPNLNTTADADPRASPYVTNAIYNVSVQFTYETSEVRYETRIRVAPGEADA